jgi:hypothetical protein
MTSPRPRPPATTDRARALAEVRASKAAASFHAFDKSEEIAKRVKDSTALEKALLGKLEAQRDFAAQYVALFPDGVNLKYRGSDSAVRSSADDFCLGFGFHVRTVRRWCELLNPAIYVRRKNEILRRIWELAELRQSASFSSASAEWYTPAPYIEAAREVLGAIDLDPASSAQANATVRATAFFSKDDDGLARDWSGRAFLNPPYGKTADGDSLAAVFCNKATVASHRFPRDVPGTSAMAPKPTETVPRSKPSISARRRPEQVQHKLRLPRSPRRRGRAAEAGT